jgi:prolipoprotein diacylglyceryltransferase
MLGAIPYHTFPEVHVGPIPVRVFGLFVGLGIVVGTAVFLRFARWRELDWNGLPKASARTSWCRS